MRARAALIAAVLVASFAGAKFARADCPPSTRLGAGFGFWFDAEEMQGPGIELSGGRRLTCHLQLGARALWLHQLRLSIGGPPSGPDPYVFDTALLARLGIRKGRLGAGVGAGPALVLSRHHRDGEFTTAGLGFEAAVHAWFGGPRWLGSFTFAVSGNFNDERSMVGVMLRGEAGF